MKAPFFWLWTSHTSIVKLHFHNVKIATIISILLNKYILTAGNCDVQTKFNVPHYTGYHIAFLFTYLNSFFNY